MAVLLADLNGGGVQRMSLVVADHLARRGHRVDLVVCEAGGELEAAVPGNVRRISLARRSGLRGRLAAALADPAGIPVSARPLLLAQRVSPTLGYLPALVDYLRRERPDALIVATPNNNIEAVLARRLSGVPTRLIVTERTALAEKLANSPRWRHRYLPPLLRRAYLAADAIVAVSDALADDLAAVARIPRERILTIYNPLVSDELARLAREPVDHPWFVPGAPPVVLAAGRLTEVKDPVTLIEAFAALRRRRPARLVILGRAKDPERTEERKAELYALADRLGVRADVDLPGYVHNP
ncbi:MAG: glycosyltransferase, partial [Geminicoccaceae bacterium]|nr:glycosyltransferase [Geminicoccaceae bacterium]